MYYCLNDNVYLVKGKAKDCIYDLGNKKLYHIQKDFSALIEKICSENIDELNLTYEEDKAIESLKSAGLVDISDEIKPFPNIRSLGTDFDIEFVWIEICTFCNLKCKHCYNESSAQCHETMSFDDFKSVCQELLGIGVKRVQLIGGEPFCHKNIREMLEYTAERFVFVEVFTNGILINEQWCEFFKDNNIHVALSIYSYDAEEHDKVTLLKGSHSRTVHSVELLKQYDIPHRIATVYMKDVSVGEKNTDLYTLNPKKDVIRMAGRGNIGLLTPELLKRKLITKKTFSYALDSKAVACHVNGHRCFSSKLYISANLEVYPCVMERRFSHGNMKDDNLENLIKREIQEFTKDKVEGCKDCEFRYACYDCRPDSLSDDIYAKPYYCTYDVNKGEFMNEDDVIKNILCDNLENKEQ
ncbi:MAG: radical SAM protein [Ruminococcus flavefaciens]|nr:radical SAM protein [Ruminococcus flavefaciens]